jgi:hypothetical protein
MLKPKVALVKSGFLPPGSENKRGRLSAEAIAECKRLVAEEGYKIDGYSLSDNTDSDNAPVVERVKTDPNRILDIPENPLRDERDWEAYVNVGGKVIDVGMRTVDTGNCGNSLTYCGCTTPLVRIPESDNPVPVSFKARTKPLVKWY